MRESFDFEMGVKRYWKFSRLEGKKLGILPRVLLSLGFWFAIFQSVNGLRPLRERARSWGDEVSFELY